MGIRDLRRGAARAIVAAGALVVSVGGVSGTWASGPEGTGHVTGAVFTTVNAAVDGPDTCFNGNPENNCNIYAGKEFVWLSGGPDTAYVGDGSYFFAVLAPGGQADPDGTERLLSEDSIADRTYSVTNGAITNLGSHDLDGNKIRLMPYLDTPNPGGVYILAVCSVDGPDDTDVNPSNCKYDAFKIKAGDDGGGETTTTTARPVVRASPLSVIKDAQGDYIRAFSWGVAKQADQTIVKQVGGTATFTYAVDVTHDTGVVSGVTVTGTITVVNPNGAPVGGVTVTDALSDGTVCDVTDGAAITLPPSNVELKTTLAYTCSLPSLPDGPLANTVTATWPEQTLADDSVLDPGSADFTFAEIDFAEHPVDDCATVSDLVWTETRTLCAADPSPTNFTYVRTVTLPTWDCLGYGNTASAVTDDTGTAAMASQQVTVCGPAKTGALTIGYWQNKNGQAQITGQTTGQATLCPSTPYLRQYAPFQDLSETATCSQAASYVTRVIKAANASGTSMNAMLKAQMLATALDVQFSATNLGGLVVDLTKVCKDIALCTIYENTSPVFGGTPSLTVSELLEHAAGQSNMGGSSWYGNVKAVQELAKDTFDAINNRRIFAA